MRLMLICFLVTCFFNDLAAQGVTLAGEIGNEGVNLKAGWKFRTGDHASWKDPYLDDSGWQPIDPNMDIYQLPEIVPGEIGWLRLSIKTDSISAREYGMVMQSSAASEMYLDGSLIHTFGLVSNNPDSVRAYDPLLKPVTLFFPKQESHVLAIRFVLQPNVHYSTMYETRNPVMQIQLIPIKQAIDTYQNFLSTIVGMHLIIIGTCLLLAILHFAFYIFYPSQKGNLLVSVYGCGFILFNIIQFYFFLYGHDVATKFYLANISMDIRMGSNLLLVLAIYNLLEKPLDLIFWILVGLTVASLFLNIWPYDKGWKIGGAFMEILCAAAISRIAYHCTRQKKRGAWIMLGGSISYFIFFGAFFSWILMPNNSFLLNLSLPRIVLYVLSFLSIPLATSILLGLDFAFANISLKEKLDEVELLSTRSIQQEREKQELLATQNETLEMRVAERTVALSKSLHDLKTTQSQLIQSEKMASLGELTAGIAHEIQNPLNFVNNFSEVNKELIAEMKLAIEQQQYGDAQMIANDILANQEKICHHGGRADSIVKGMLQHSRNHNDLKSPVSINKLTEEYLRLAYHGMRGKNKDFNTTVETEFDESVGTMEVVAAEIGRVILNLVNNAFYAVQDRMRFANSVAPVIKIKTKRLPEYVEISVQDNGSGVPLEVIDKIFQPFFTTKPTGQGTGLGLSLSYDIITKGHGGTLKVISREGEGATFIIQLPAN